MLVRRATSGDLDAILAISNRAARETAANFAIEPESIDAWRRDFDLERRLREWREDTSPEAERLRAAWPCGPNIQEHPRWTPLTRKPPAGGNRQAVG